MSKSNELINKWKRNSESPSWTANTLLFFPQQLVHFLLSCPCVYVLSHLSGVFFLAGPLRGEWGGSSKMSLCWILEGQKKTESSFMAQQSIQEGKAPGIGMFCICPSANIGILLYSIKRFIEVLVSLPPSFTSKETKFLCWRIGPTLSDRQRPSDVRSYPYNWMFSTNMLLPTTGGPSCELLKFVQFALEAYHLLLFAQYPKKVGWPGKSDAWRTSGWMPRPKTNYQKHLTDATWWIALPWSHWWQREPKNLVVMLWTSLWGPHIYLPCTTQGQSQTLNRAVQIRKSPKTMCVPNSLLGSDSQNNITLFKQYIWAIPCALPTERASKSLENCMEKSTHRLADTSLHTNVFHSFPNKAF